MDQVCGVTVKLSKVDQLKVQDALESVESLKFKVKKQMAARRIVDLTHPQKPKVEEQKEDDSAIDKITKEAQMTETFNTMVIDTREKINEAMNVLFSRDSKLRKLQSMQENTPALMKSASR